MGRLVGVVGAGLVGGGWGSRCLTLPSTLMAVDLESEVTTVVLKSGPGLLSGCQSAVRGGALRCERPGSQQ